MDIIKLANVDSITGNYLTSKAHANIRSDREMLKRIGRKVR